MTQKTFTKQEKLTVFNKATEIVLATKRWASSEIKVVRDGKIDGKQAQFYLARGKDGINLFLFVEGRTLMQRFTSAPFRVAYFNPETGLQISQNATEAHYLQWNRQVRRAIGI